MKCPYCEGVVEPGMTVCPDCHEDLSALVHLEQEHVIYYNQALALARDGHLGEARDKLLIAVAMSDSFVLAHRLLAKIYARQKDWPGARLHALRAAELAPQDRPTRELLDQIASLGEETRTVQKQSAAVRRRSAEGILASYQRDVLGAFAVGAGLAAFGAFLLSLLGSGRRRKS